MPQLKEKKLHYDPSIYLHGKYLVLDVETSTLDRGSSLNMKNNLVLACWYFEGEWKHKFGAEYEQKELLKDIAKADFIVAQNAKFELGWLDRCGLDIHDVLVWDTMLAEWVLLGNRTQPKNLGAMLKRRNLKGKEDVVAGLIELGIDCNSIPKQLLKEYCFEDVRGTFELFESQRKEVVENKLLHLVYSRCLLTPVLSDIEKQGIYLDKEAVEQEYESCIKERNEAQAKLEEFGTINFNSKQQVAALLYDELGFEEVKFRGKEVRTASGQRSASKDTIARLRPKTASQREFLATYSKLANLNAKLSKTLQFYKEVCDGYGNTFYGILNQGVTGTHRLSSSGRTIIGKDGEEYKAQLQNQPREYKKLVVARQAGWEIWESDGSQLEFRVAADLGRDKVAYEEISNDVDIHNVTARTLTEAGELTTRQEAKAATFRPLYGGTSGSKALQAYCKFFQNKYKGIYDTQTKWVHEVLKTGKLRTPYGLIFYWPDTKIQDSGYVTNTTAIFNYGIQGFATAEIIPIVLFTLWHKLKDWQVRIILTIHDSIVMEVGPDVDKEALRVIIAEAFTKDVYNYLEAVYGYKFHVPLGLEIKMGDKWGSGKAVKAKVFPENRNEIIWQ